MQMVQDMLEERQIRTGRVPDLVQEVEQGTGQDMVEQGVLVELGMEVSFTVIQYPK
jgi:hypothetical protein